MKLRYIVIGCLLIYTLIIILPPIIHGYVYPNMSDDTAFHLQYIDSVKNGQSADSIYLGRKLVAQPIIWVSDIIGVSTDTLFIWFNYAVLVLMGVTTCAVLGLLINWWAGLISIPLMIFATQSTLVAFNNGSIFDLATVGILLPLFLLCAVKTIVTKKWYWIIGVLGFGAFTYLFHSIAVFQSGVKEDDLSIPVLFFAYIGIPAFLFYLISTGWVWWKGKETDKSKSQAFYTIIILTVITTMIMAFALLNVTSYSVRLGMDTAMLFALLSACAFGLIAQYFKMHMVTISLLALVGIGALVGIRGWFGYNSAITEMDKKAISYVNNLSGEYYSCSPELAPWIYDRYLNKKYNASATIYIYRSEPMTYKTANGGWSEDDITYGKRPPERELGGYVELTGGVFMDSDLVIVVENR